MMKTTDEIITEMEELPPEEIRVIIRHFESEEEFSEEDTALILQASEDAKRGVNMSGPFNTTEEIFAHLDSLKPE